MQPMLDVDLIEFLSDTCLIALVDKNFKNLDDDQRAKIVEEMRSRQLPMPALVSRADRSEQCNR